MTVAGLVSKAGDVQKGHVGNAVLVQKAHLRLRDSVQKGHVKAARLVRFVAVTTYLAYILSSIVADEWKLTR